MGAKHQAHDLQNVQSHFVALESMRCCCVSYASTAPRGGVRHSGVLFQSARQPEGGGEGLGLPFCSLEQEQGPVKKGA